MKLGFVTAILPDFTFEEVLQTASEIGYDCVEVMCWPVGKAERRYAGVTHIDVNNLTDELVTEIQNLVNKYRVSISALGYYPNPLTPDPSERKIALEQIRNVIRAAEKLGVGVVNSFTGRDWKKSVEDNWPMFIETWEPIVSFAEDHNIKIGIENCPMLFTANEWPGGKNLFTTPYIWGKGFKDIPGDHFGLNFDPSHFIWQQMDYIKAIRDFGYKFYHVHAKDVLMEKHKLDGVGIMGYPNDYHTPKLPGLGDVDWEDFFFTLTAVGYEGAVCVEVEDRAYEGTTEKRIDALRTSYNYLRQFIPAS